MVSYKEVDSLPRRAAVIPAATQPCLPSIHFSDLLAKLVKDNMSRLGALTM